MLIDFITSDQTIRVDEVFINNLRYMHSLKMPDFSKVKPFPSDDSGDFSEKACDFNKCLAYNSVFREALRRIFDYSADRMRAGGRDRELSPFLEKALPDESLAKWWVAETDVAHTVASFDYLVDICNKESFSYNEQLTVLSSILVHDCAYPPTDEHTKIDVRLEHMVEGVKAFEIIARSINAEFRRMHTIYDFDVVEEFQERVPFPNITEENSIIGQHDNPSIGRLFSYESVKPRMVWAHREADRLWMLDKAGFALDLLRLLKKSKPYNPEKLLRHVIGRHVEEGESYPDNQNCRTIQDDIFDFEGKKTLYRTDAGYQMFLELINERAREYNIRVH
jgi:hypothetical protein